MSRGLSTQFTKREGQKGDLLARCEDYALYTLPHIFPRTGNKDQADPGPLNSTGPRAVNHLSNKLVLTLFQPSKPFFILEGSSEDIQSIIQLADEGDTEAAELLEAFDKELIQKEKEVMKALDYAKFRTEATTTAQLLIITGNALMYFPVTGAPVQVYSVRDYCVKRDLSGNVIDVLTRDTKAFGTFSKEVQEKLRQRNPKDKYSEDTDVTLYTQVTLKADGKYHLYQEADDVNLHSKGAWTKDELPWLPLTWNRARGNDYGTGLVEEYSGALKALYTLDQAAVSSVAIAAEVKFLVSPSSVLDVNELNESETGTYHAGEEGDISTLQLDKFQDLQAVLAYVQRLEQQVASAFLMNSSIQRQAERVTAEEIRYMANELETSHGGVYSRFADEWQKRIAILKLKETGTELEFDGLKIEPRIITGLDSLSRAGELDNFKLFMNDLAQFQTVPPELLREFSLSRTISFIGARRGIDYETLKKTTSEKEQEAQAQAQMNQQMMAQQAGANVAEEAGKAAVKGGE